MIQTVMRVNEMKPLRVSAVALMLSGTLAQAATIDFDTFGDGDLVTSVASDDGTVTATVSAVGGADEARAFDTTNTASHDNDLEGPFVNDLDDTIFSALAGNVLIVQEEASMASGTPDDNADGGTITFTFGQLIDLTGFTIYDDATVTITADTGATATRSVGQDGAFNTFAFDPSLFAGVSWLSFDFNGHSGAIDDLLVEVSAVPIPASLPLLLAGLGGLVALRRRKS